MVMVRCEVESYLSALLSAVVPQPLAAVYQGITRHFSTESDWFFFRTTDGKEFSLCFSPDSSGRAEIAHFETVARIGEKLAHSCPPGQMDLPLQVEGFSKEPPCCGYLFTVLSAVGRCQYLGELLYAETCFEPLCRKEQLGQELTEFLSSLLPVRVSLQIDAERLFCIVAAHIGGKDTMCLARLERICGNKIQLEVLEKQMDTERIWKDQISCTLALGEIEMPLSEFLHLRPGAKIEFERPQGLEACLQLSGCDWARVAVAFEQQEEKQRVVLEVKSIVSLEQIKNQEQLKNHSLEETLGKNDRLIEQVQKPDSDMDH